MQLLETLDLEKEHSFSSNSVAGGTPTPQDAIFLVGWAEEFVLAIAPQEVYFALIACLAIAYLHC